MNCIGCNEEVRVYDGTRGPLGANIEGLIAICPSCWRAGVRKVGNSFSVGHAALANPNTAFGEPAMGAVRIDRTRMMPDPQHAIDPIRCAACGHSTNAAIQFCRQCPRTFYLCDSCEGGKRLCVPCATDRNFAAFDRGIEEGLTGRRLSDEEMATEAEALDREKKELGLGPDDFRVKRIFGNPPRRIGDIHED